ncbi:17866_t:CDS:2, partial [Gigaspora rosea]
TYEKLVMIDGIHFIASNVGERVLITSHVHDSSERIKMDLNEVDSEEDFQNIKGYKGRFITWSLSYENFTFTLGVYHKYWEEIFNNPSLAGRFLPQPDFDEIINANVDDIDEIIKTYDIELSESEIFSYLCNQLLKDYINEKFFLAYYGKILMEKFLTLNKSLWVEELFKNCIKKCPNEKDSYDLYSNIQFLNIITQCYSELIQKNPVIVHGFLSQMTFVVPSVEAKDDNVYLSSLSHLHYYDIQNNKWTTLERPYVPPSIVEITLAEDQSETEISQIKKGLEDLTSIKPDLASIKNGLEGLTRVKKELEELTSIKKELKGLTSLFDNFKNEVMTELNKLQTS